LFSNTLNPYSSIKVGKRPSFTPIHSSYWLGAASSSVNTVSTLKLSTACRPAGMKVGHNIPHGQTEAVKGLKRSQTKQQSIHTEMLFSATLPKEDRVAIRRRCTAWI
jgi:hypothetical protein